MKGKQKNGINAISPPVRALQKIIAIVGPTASGKSDLAIGIARRFNGEIISADSRQVYKGMDLGTGKVTKHEQRLAKHYLLDVADPKEQFTVADFKRLGEKAIKEILRKKRVPIIVGGTGFYIDVLLADASLPDVPPNKKLRAKLEKQSAEQLFNKLSELDPRRGNEIDPRNKRRLIRALEIIEATGKAVPVPRHKKEYEILWLGLKVPSETLKKRIKRRLNERFRQGMVAEVKKIVKHGVSYKRLYDLGLEYRWIARFIKGEISKPEMEKALFGAIFQYSKRQMTWFKRNKEVTWSVNPKELERLAGKFIE